MRVSARCVLRSALLSFAFSLVLVVMLAVMANGLASADVSVRAVEAIGFVVALLVRTYAAVIGARAARGEELERKEVVLSAVLGLAIGYVALQLLNAFVEVVALARQLSVGWDSLYGILPWLLAGVLGGWLATRRRRRTGSQDPTQV